MKTHNARFIVVLAYVVFLSSVTIAAAPRVTNNKYRLELVAAEPEIVTPIGMAFDRKGRLLVIESHTHQDPEEYKGPEHDRLRMLADSDGDGRLDRWSTLAEGFHHAMNVLVRDDGGVYVVERGRLLLLRDTNDDGSADNQEILLRLETEDDYPHNALGGIDQTKWGQLIIGLGENHGLPFRLIGADGKEIAATGGLDGFFRCTPDGKNLEHLARGVWNPFSLCVVPDGRIFAVDNDPDASPPCRLLHVVPGGDYGYLYQYGRAGTHPLQAWNGALPGTLPMVCGSGEAPTAIVDHAGSLWVTSWGDHRIERYQLVPRGASYGATREVVVQGGSDFRPTGMAVAPDGSLYFGDWVLRDYPVHGRGRIWCLRLPDDEKDVPFPPESEEDRKAESFRQFANTISPDSDDPFLFASGVFGFSRESSEVFEKWGTHIPEVPMSPGLRLTKIQARRLRRVNHPERVLREALRDESPDVRLFAVRWIADDRITSLRDDVAKLLDGPQPNAQYHLAVLAAVDWLDHEPEMRGREIADELLVRELENNNRSPEIHALALRSLSPDNKFLTIDRLETYLRSDYLPLRREAARSLTMQSNYERFEILAAAAADESQTNDVRLEAIMGLAAAANRYQSLLVALADHKRLLIREESQRALRLAGLRPAADEEKPPASDLAAWNKLLGNTGSVAAGRRLFFSSVAARCGVCHEHSGRGGRIGPDLTNIAKSSTREKLIASILQPDQEIAPHYQPWLLVTDDGKTHTGLRMHEGGDDGSEEYVNSAGERFLLESKTIEVREATATSIMPSGLETLVSIVDLCDLVTFLMESK
jgi:putative membrane-bound dehydrogenase-like protein